MYWINDVRTKEEPNMKFSIFQNRILNLLKILTRKLYKEQTNFAGFNDIGFRNPEVISPNLDQLARDGVILDRNYVQPICTPSRSSLMTGMYPYKIGRQVSY